MSAALWAGQTHRRISLLTLCVLVCCAGFLFVAGPAAAADDAPDTASNSTVSESVVESDTPDPASDRLGWEHGVWANATLSIDQSDGINQTELEAVVARTMARVEAIRGIEFDRTPPVRVLFPREQRSETEAQTFGDAQRTLLNAEYEALFLINESRDAVESRRALIGGGVNGYYSTTTGNVTMVSPNSSVRQIREGVLAQELFHAQQDNQFDLPEVESIEERNTRNSYVEGDANYVQRLYEQRCGGAWDGTCYQPDRDSVPDLSGLNTGMRRLFQQPYQSGYAFVSDRHQQMGWEAVDRLYEHPPASTEQVIHPETYGEDQPTELRVDDRSTDAWQPLRAAGERVTGSVGEAGLYVSLLHPATQTSGQAQIIPLRNHATGGLGDPVTASYAHPATAGWDGDRLVPYVPTAGNGTGYVYETVWDTPDDAREFHEAYRKLLAYHGADPVSGPDHTYRIPEDDGFSDAFYVNRTGDRLRIVNAPSVEALSEIRRGVGSQPDGSQPAPPWDRADLTWEVSLDSERLSSPALSDGTLVVGGVDTAVYGVEETTGELAWTQQVNDTIISSPTVSGGTVYAGTIGSSVAAIDGATGELTWTQQVSGAVVSPPTVSDGTVYVGTPAGRLHALDAATGDQEWSYRLNGTATRRPVVLDGTVLVGNRTGLSAVNATTGDLTWHAEFTGAVLSEPEVSAGTVYTVTLNRTQRTGRIHATDAVTGETRWTYETNETASPWLTAANGRVYATSSDVEASTGRLLALAGDSGNRQWSVSLNGSVTPSPVVSNGTVYAGSSVGQLHAVAASSGDRRWVVPTDGAVNSPLVVRNGTVYAGSRGGLLSALDAATGDVRWTVIADGLASVSPTLANGTVYAKAGPTLFAVRGPTSVPGDEAPDGSEGEDGADGPGNADDTPAGNGDADDTPAGNGDADDTPAGNGDADDTPAGNGDADDTPAGNGDGPGLGVLAALFALVAVVVFARLVS